MRTSDPKGGAGYPGAERGSHVMDDRHDPDAELPIKLEPCSNGEFLPLPITPVAAETIRRTRDEADRQARRLGLSRRTFLRSVAGAALMLTVLDRTAREAHGATGGRYNLPVDAASDADVARSFLGGDEFIFDVQVHYLNFDLAQPGELGVLGNLFPQKNCGETDPRACFAVDHLVEEMLLKSDTDMLVMSSIPIPGDANPLSIEDMETVKRLVTELCGRGRVLTQGQTFPSIGTAAEQLEAMRLLREEHKIAAWKVYTHAGGPPWWLDDHEAGVSQSGVAFLENVRELGPKIVAVHKGFGLVGGPNRGYADPIDIGPAAEANPDIKFVVYHSGYEPGETEGPYTPETATQGVNRLITSARTAGIGKDGNIYPELGSTWRSVMGDPTQAAHVLGKLLAEFGADRIVWGTDSIWYGSPQDQIAAFRAFQITPEFQERFGYPALTDDVKQQILSANAAALFGIAPPPAGCPAANDDGAGLRSNRTYGPVARRDVEATFTREHPWTVERTANPRVSTYP
ncbi:MAG: amidohydrolase family protein [Actinobacteria bacterium]|nr:amidohydrolase family protein [Actinomycetota bacterium]